MKKLRSIRDLKDLSGKTVLLASNFDVPLNGENVTSNYRIKAAIPTIKMLIEKNARIVILSHLGRPAGEYKDEFSLMPVRFELGKLLETHIKFAHIPSSHNSVVFMEDGEVLLLENVRFHPREESKKEEERTEFMKELAEQADYYVNDAFASYRPTASTFELAKLMKNPMAGLLIEKEVESLTKLLEEPEKPYVAVIGGAKLDTKIPILHTLIEKADSILLGGAMAYTFMKAKGIDVGDSKVEDDKLKEAKQIMDLAKKAGCEIVLPVDHIAAKSFDKDAEAIEVDAQVIGKGLIGMDIGERTMQDFQERIENAKTVMWNGPMGVFEWEQFSRGTEAVGEYIGLSAPRSTYKVAGGGDTITAMEQLKINFKNYNHVSTGGGAMLAFLSGEELPTLEPLYK